MTTPLTRATHFQLEIEDGIALVTLNRPEKKNPLTFESYAELRDFFRDIDRRDDIQAIVITGAGGNFCSGGDVFEIIQPLLDMDMKQLLAFTRMTGDLAKYIHACPVPVISAIDGVCAGAGAMIALFSDIRFGTPEAKTAFLFSKVGLAGCDMGACAMLPRMIGQGRAAELLYSGRAMTAEEGFDWGFYNRLVPQDALLQDAMAYAAKFAAGPNFAHMMTKTMLNQEWSMSIAQAIEAEAQSQAICMQTRDFQRAFDAFAAKERPVFKGD